MRVSKDNVLVAAVSLAIGMAGSAGAAGLITGSQIQDGSIGIKDLSKSLRKKLQAKSGPVGTPGPKGDPGAAFDSSSFLPLTGGTLTGALAVQQTVGVGAGSAATPAIAFIGDPDTGIYAFGSSLGFAVSGLPKVRLSTQELEVQNGFLRAGMDHPPAPQACGTSDLGRMVVVANDEGSAHLYICDDSSAKGFGGEWIVK